MRDWHSVTGAIDRYRSPNAVPRMASALCPESFRAARIGPGEGRIAPTGWRPDRRKKLRGWSLQADSGMPLHTRASSSPVTRLLMACMLCLANWRGLSIWRSLERAMVGGKAHHREFYTARNPPDNLHNQFLAETSKLAGPYPPSCLQIDLAYVRKTLSPLPQGTCAVALIDTGSGCGVFDDCGWIRAKSVDVGDIPRRDSAIDLGRTASISQIGQVTLKYPVVAPGLVTS